MDLPDFPYGSPLTSWPDPILDDDNNVIACPNMIEQLAWMRAARESGRICVGALETPYGKISTVFLGLDLNFGQAPPHYFETALFPVRGSVEVCARYSTWAEATAGHTAFMEACERNPELFWRIVSAIETE